MRRARSLEEGEWVMMIDDWLLIIDCLHTENTDDTDVRRRTIVGEHESSEFKRNLNGGPQADGGGERQLENNKYPQMSQMDTD